MTPNKTTEQPIPKDFKDFCWIEIQEALQEEDWNDRFDDVINRLTRVFYEKLRPLPSSPVETKVSETAPWEEERQRLWYFWGKINHFVDQLWNDGIVNGKVDDKYVKRVCQVQEVGHKELSKYQNPYDHPTTESTPSPVGEETKEGFLRGHAPTIFSYLADHVLNDIYCAMQAYADRPNPSRAGEISPALPRWVKASERTPPDNRLVFFKAIFPENIIHMRSGYWDGRWFNCNSGYYKVPWPDYSIEWLEEAPPIPAEVKEDQYEQWHPQDYSGKNAAVEQIAHVPVILPSGARATVSPDASPELLNALDKMVELAKEMPEPQPNISGYLGPEGCIPQEVMDWIGSEYKKPNNALYNFDQFREGAMLMYRKMTANAAKSLSYWIVKARNEQISTLTSERDQLGAEIIHWTLRLEEMTKERDTARQENESLIASVEGWESKYHRAEEEVGQYRKALEGAKAALINMGHGDCFVTEHIMDTLAKYSSTGIKPTT